MQRENDDRHASSGDLELAQSAAGGDCRSFSILLKRLEPVLRQRVRRVFASRRREAIHSVADEADLLQEVRLSLFLHRQRVLAAWDPSRGLSLPSFVGLFAERTTHSMLRTRRYQRNELCSDHVLEQEIAEERFTPEQESIDHQHLWLTFARVRQHLSGRSDRILTALMFEGLSVEAVCAKFQMQRDAVYQFKTRMHRLLERVGSELERTP